jgi:hypothetical protein
MTTEISTQRAGGLALQTFDDAFRFAKMVSSSEFAPKDFKGKPESCLLAIQHGSEVGLSPMQSLQSIAVINGRPTIWGDAALALVQSSPVCEYVREYVEGQGDTLTAVCEAKRKGYPAPTVSRFSMADAKRAGLAGKSGPWSQYPERMLALRARGFALRNAFADCLRGLVTAEEAQDYTTPQQDHGPAGGAYAQFVKPQSEPVVVRPKFDSPASVTDDPMGKARIAVSDAKTIEALDKLRRLVEERTAQGKFSREQHDELVALMRTKAEMLIGDSEDSDVEHFDAAEIEAEARA